MKKDGGKEFGVLMIGPYERDDEYRGISSVISCYFKSNDFGKYKVEYLATSQRGSTIKKIWCLLAGIARCTAMLIFTNIRIVHIHAADYLSFPRKMIFALLALVLKKRIILHIHGAQFQTFYSHNPKPFRAAISFVLDRADIIVVLSDYWVNYFRTITRNQHLRVLYNPVVGASFVHNLRNQDRAKANVLYMTMLTRDKGIYDLLNSIPLVLRNQPSAVFSLCGGGDIERCKEICDRMGIRESVKFLGWVSGEEKIQQFKKANVFVLPSYFEGLPVSLIEAMFSGLPIVTTSVGGIPDVFQEGLNGYMISPGDITGLADRVLRLLKDMNSRQIIGDHNRVKAHELFDIGVVMKKLTRIYDEAIAYSSTEH